MYQTPQGEPSGCMQTLVLSRMILGILMVPFLLMLGGIFLVLLTFYALTINPLLALLVIAGGIGLIALIARWESRRIAKDMPPGDN